MTRARRLLPLGAMVAFLAFHDRSRLRGLFRRRACCCSRSSHSPGSCSSSTSSRTASATSSVTRCTTASSPAFTRATRNVRRLRIYVPVLLAGSCRGGRLHSRLRRAGRVAQAPRAGAGARPGAAAAPLLVPAAARGILPARSRLQLYVLRCSCRGTAAGAAARELAWLDGRRTPGSQGRRRSHCSRSRGPSRTGRRIVTHGPCGGPAARGGPARHRGNRVRQPAPFYGLTLYLPRRSRACISRDGPRVFQVPLRGDALLRTAVAREEPVRREARPRRALREGSLRCVALTPVEVGSFEADDNELALYVVRARPPDRTARPAAIRYLIARRPARLSGRRPRTPGAEGPAQRVSSAPSLPDRIVGSEYALR